MDKLKVTKSQINNGITLANVLHVNAVTQTLDEAKRFIINGSVAVNGETKTNFNLPITLGLIADGGIVSVGKSKQYKLFVDTKE